MITLHKYLDVCQLLNYDIEGFIQFQALSQDIEELISAYFI